MDIEKSILHYLKVFDGSKKQTVNAILEDFAQQSISKGVNIGFELPYAFSRLENRKTIEIIPYTNLSPMQQASIKSGDCFYRIIN